MSDRVIGKADKATAVLTYGNIVYELEFTDPAVCEFDVQMETVKTLEVSGWVTRRPTGNSSAEVHLRGAVTAIRSVVAPAVRTASSAARAKLYGNFLDRNLKPDDINAIPDELFNEMALGCEPEPVVMDMQSPSADEMGRLLKLLRKHIRHQGGDTTSVVGKP